MKVGVSLLSGAATVTNLNKENHKNRRFSYLSLKTNAMEFLYFFSIYLCLTSTVWGINFNCWSYIFIVKKTDREIIIRWQSKSIAVFISTYQENLLWSAPSPIFSTLNLVHLKKIGLSMKKFIGSWCIHSIRSSHGHKFEQRKFKKWKIFLMLI